MLKLTCEIEFYKLIFYWKLNAYKRYSFSLITLNCTTNSKGVDFYTHILLYINAWKRRICNYRFCIEMRNELTHKSYTGKLTFRGQFYCTEETDWQNIGSLICILLSLVYFSPSDNAANNCRSTAQEQHILPNSAVISCFR